MAQTRYGRLEERRQQKRLALAIVGTLAIVAFFVAFGFKLLVGFSLLIEKLHGNPQPTQNPSQAVIFPPTLDPLPVATKSSSIVVTGSGQVGLTLVLYLNDQELQDIPVTKSGTFKMTIPNLKDGTNTISAKLTDNKGSISDLSNVLTVDIKQKQPTLTVSFPADGTTILGDNNMVTVSGITDDNTTVTINGRFVVVRSDNSFSYQYPLNTGQNKLTIVAADEAGNTTTVERTITYQK